MAEKPYCLSCDTSSACHAANECLDGNMPKKAAPLSAGAVPELPKLYANRDPVALDKAGGYHMRHRMAMTAEGLHSKGDIADELGWRDQQIDAAQATIHAQAAEIERLKREHEADERNNAEALKLLAGADAQIIALKAKQVAEATYGTNSGPVTREVMAAFQANLTNPRDHVVRPVADVDEVMRLADAMGRHYADWVTSGLGRTLMLHNAAREALRAFLTKDRT